MKSNWSLMLLGSFFCLILIAKAQETAPETTNNENVPSEATSLQPDSSSRFFKKLPDNFRQGFGSARSFMRNRMDDIRQGINMTRMQTYRMFMSLYNKTYLPQEIPRRMALFFKRREEIRQSVKAYLAGKASFVMKENAFTDWDDKELKKLTGVSLPSKEQLEAEDREFSEPKSVASIMNNINSNDPNISVKADKLPESKDWRSTGCVYAPINQKSCGACYAIATMSVVESMRCLKTSWAPRLSPQQIVDCATPSEGYRNHGCNGGWPTRVLNYLQDKEVAARGHCYPYVMKQEKCKLEEVKDEWACATNASTIVGKKLRFKVLRNEDDILYHVANTGPVVTAIEATRDFVYYGDGIFDDKNCSNGKDDVDHAIVIVGYGSEKGQDYWIIKNSWGTEWGDGGYAKYRRNKNACSIGHYGWAVLS